VLRASLSLSTLQSRVADGIGVPYPERMSPALDVSGPDLQRRYDFAFLVHLPSATALEKAYYRFQEEQ